MSAAVSLPGKPISSRIFSAAFLSKPGGNEEAFYSPRAGVEPLTYEHMMSDWVGFMDRVEGILGMEISEHHRQTLRLRGQIGVEHAGDVNSHRRRGTPGDYLEKLQPQTIAALNERFDVHLKWLGLVESDEVEIDLRVTPTRTAAA